MNEQLPTIPRLFVNHVKGTAKEAIVADRRALICHLTKAVLAGINLEMIKVYITTRVIKHLYDKRPAQEFDLILKKAYNIIREPDEIYKNLDPKRGEYGFVKKIGNQLFFCSIEIEKGDGLAVATIFKLSKPESYLKNYKSLWRWKDGTPSS